MKKLLIGGIVAGAALIAPVFASAQVIPFGNYTGTFTTQNPGSVSVDVSGDGTTVDVSFDSFGPPGPSGCISGFSRDVVPISGNSFSIFEPPPPFTVSATGTFDSPGVVTGTAQMVASCDSGSQSFTATTPVAWADALISAGGKTKGEDVYTQDGGGKQTLKRSAKKGKSARFKIGVENDGTIEGLFNVNGCKAKAATYKAGGENVTDEVKSNDGYQPEIDAGEDVAIQLKYAAKGRPGSTKKCEVTANGDTVVALTKIKRK